MGSKRVGLARTQALIENLKRDLNLGSTSISGMTGDITMTGGITAEGACAFNGTVTIGAGNALTLTSDTKVTATIAVTHSVNTDVGFTQPADSILKDLIAIPTGDIVTGGGGTDDLDISLGTSAGGTQLLAATALLDGASVTWAANTPLYIIENSHGHAANQFAVGVGPFCGPATTEAITPAASLYSATARELHIRLTPINTNLATANTTVKFIVVWQMLKPGEG